jgi:hypothetical protein
MTNVQYPEMRRSGHDPLVTDSGKEHATPRDLPGGGPGSRGGAGLPDDPPGHLGEHSSGLGVSPTELSDEDLIRELESLHRTRNDTLRHGPDDALAHHDRRTAELEREYLRRYPDREISRGEDAHRPAPPRTQRPAKPIGSADSGDFAGEHSSSTVADQMPGGPEGAREPESPRGYAGMDG